MKKIIKLSLVLMMVLALSACKQTEQEQEQNTSEIKTGVLSQMVSASRDQAMAKHVIAEHNSDFQGNGERILYNNISAVLLALNSGEIQYFGTNAATADYIAGNNDGLMVHSPTGVIMQTEFSMLTMEDDAETYDILNDTIVAFKEDGTLEQLIASYIETPDGNFDAEVNFPAFEGADTIRIAITGDIPPLDYTADNGKAAGFNVALLAAIAEYNGINIEPVIMESASRFTALASGKVDAIFWVCATTCKDHPEVRVTEPIDNTKITEPYIVLDAAMVYKK